MSTKGIVIAFLIFFGLTTLASSLMSFSIFGIGDAQSAIAAITLAMSIGFFSAAAILWKKWEE